MLIKQPILSKVPNVNRKYIWVIAGLLLFGLAGFAFKYFVVFPPEKAEVKIIECGAENIKIVDKKKVFEQNGFLFENGNTQSSKMARTGKYASALPGETKYGMLYQSGDFAQNEIYRVTVWRYSQKMLLSYLVVSSIGNDKIYKQVETSTRIDDKGWEQLELLFTVPKDYKIIKIYVTKAGQDDVFFDDLRIERVSKEEQLSLAASDTGFVQLDLVMKDKAVKKIEEKRNKALATGILFSADDDWVKGSLKTPEETLPVKLRLKGDWMDHLKGKKWSYRVSMRGAKTWNRMVTFSLQNPYVRNHLREWVYHQMLEKEDVLTTRYDFVKLKINGAPKGIYAFEEHFEKQLVEYRNRREGPIIKFSEEGVWQARKRELDFKTQDIETEQTLRSYESAPIQPFKESKTFKSPALAQQFKLGQALLEQYRYGTKPISEIFDVDKLAKYYALLDINQAYHNIVWHNRRFYYNPVISRLEPIGFDGFTEAGIFPFGAPFLGAGMAQTNQRLISNLVVTPFLDPEFVASYIHYLNQYSQNSYIETFLLELAPAIEKREQFIQQEYPGYELGNDLIERGRYIRNLLFPLNENSLQVFTQQKNERNLSLKINNQHLLAIEVLGFGTKNDFISTKLETPLFLHAQHGNKIPDYQDIDAPLGMKFIFFGLPGIDSVFHSTISSWSAPQATVPAQDAFSTANPTSNNLYLVEKKTITFMPGKYTVDSSIVIPKGYRVTFEPGVEIDFIKNGLFLSRSPIFMMGNEEKPITIRSSDGTANGFTVLQAGERSSMSNVMFEGLNTLANNGWNLTGAVTMYESDVDIENCSFVRNHCEDALNLVRLNFSIDQILISHTFADGFDADFCEGTVNRSRFVHTGNDGLDFSGSKITISECTVDSPGDKGLSVGEQANVIVKSIRINDAIVGVASKDLSNLYIDNISLIRCQQGFTAYQKKPEFGGGKIHVNSYTAEEVKYLYRIVPGSILKLDGRIINGN